MLVGDLAGLLEQRGFELFSWKSRKKEKKFLDIKERLIIVKNEESFWTKYVLPLTWCCRCLWYCSCCCCCCGSQLFSDFVSGSMIWAWKRKCPAVVAMLNLTWTVIKSVQSLFLDVKWNKHLRVFDGILLLFWFSFLCNPTHGSKPTTWLLPL